MRVFKTHQLRNVLLGVLSLGVLFGVWIFDVFAQDSSDGMIDQTLYVFPSAVTSNDWKNVDALYSQDADADALYQDFSRNMAAYIEAPEETTISSSESSDNNEGSGDGGSFEEHVSEGGEQEESDEDGEGVSTSEEGSVPAQNAPEGNSETTSSEESLSSDPSAEESAPASSEATSLFLAPVRFAYTQIALFVDGVVARIVARVQYPAVARAEEASSTEEVSASPESAPQTPLLDESLPESHAEDVHTESRATTTEEEGGVAASSTSLTSSSTAEKAPQKYFCEGEKECGTYKLELEGFSIPELGSGEVLQDAQLRISLGAKTKEDSIQGVLVEYTFDETWLDAGAIEITDEVSNAINGGYFLYALPAIEDPSVLEKLRVRISYLGDARTLEGLYIDSAWLELSVLTLDEEALRAHVAPEALEDLQKPLLHEFLGDTIDFTVGELPQFTLKYHEQRNFIVRFFRGLFASTIADVGKVTIRHHGVGELAIEPIIHMADGGLWTIQIPEEARSLLVPGRYTLEIEVNEGSVEYVDQLEFQWGLLAVNTHKSQYQLGEIAQISFAALSSNGNTVCDADLLAYVIRPDGFISRVSVAESGQCNGNSVVALPDYFASYEARVLGTHTLYIERVDENGEVVDHTEDTFEVVPFAPLSIERSAPTRIYPISPYAMQLTVSTKEAFTGKLVEIIPLEYEATNTDAVVSVDNGVKKLTWDISLAADEAKTFSYLFDSPDISPFLYKLGPATIQVDGDVSWLTPTEAQIHGVSGATSVNRIPVSTEDIQASSTVARDEKQTTESLEVAPAEAPIEPVQEEGAAEEGVLQANPADPAPPEVDIVPVNPETLFQSTVEESAIEGADLLGDTTAASSTVNGEVSTTTTDDKKSGGSFTEKRQWQIASDATGSMLLYWDSTVIPTGWTCVSCAVTDVFYQRFVMGSSTAGTNGGAATHTHAASGTVAASGGTQGIDTLNQATPVVAHTHAYTPTISSDSHLPPYRQLAVIQYNSAGEPPSIPTGAIALFDAAVPSGWTRYSAQDGNFIRGESTSTVASTGGATTHTHTASGNTDPAVTTLNARNPGTSVSVASANHTHPVSTSTSPETNIPPYREAVIGKLNATSSASDAMIAMWTDTPASGWNVVSSSSQAFENRFVRASTTYGDAGGTTTLSHANISGVTSGTSTSPTTRDSTPVNGNVASALHTHSVSITNFSSGTILPPYRTAIFAKRLGGSPPNGPTLHDRLFDSEKTGTSTPVFEFTGADPDGSDTLVYQFQWDDDADLNTSPVGDRTSDVETGCSPNCFINSVSGGDSSPFNDGEKIRFTIQTALTSGTTYYWRVRAKETIGDVWGSWSTTTSFTYIAGTDPAAWYQTEGSQFEVGTLSNIATTTGGVELSVPAISGALVVYGEGVVQTPRYQIWNGSSWGGELSAQSVGGTVEWIRTAAGTTRNEYVMATQDASSDINVQIYNGTTTTWGNLSEVTTTVSDITRRGVDVTYETNSGDALVVYCDGDSDPSYRIWDGGSWSATTTIATVSTNNCDYISLASDPMSDEIILVTRDTGAAYEALVWDGSVWGNSQTIGSMFETNHEGIAVEYEESGDQALVVVSNGNTNGFIWNAWSGGSWNGANATVALGDDFEWGVLKRDVGSDTMALCYMDNDSDVGIVRWNGLSWETSQEIDIDGNLADGRSVSCEFETTSGRDGYLMIPYATTTNSVYDVWNGSTFTGDLVIENTIEDSWEVGSVRTGEGKILAYFHDDANTRYDFSYWNGSTWSARQMFEDTTSVGTAPFKQPIAMVAQVYQSGVGTITSDPIDFDWVPNRPTWGEVSWSTTEPSGTDVILRVYYGASCSSLVPDVALAGNSAGFPVTASPLNISGLSTSTYNQLCVRATLSSGSASLPSLDAWTVSWEREPYLVQSSYWWYANAPAITPTDRWPAGVTDLSENDPIGSGDTPPGLGSVMRLRMGVRSENVSLSASELAFKLQFASGPSCASSTSWYDVGAIGSTTAAWRGYNTSGVSDGATISSLLLSASDVGGSYEEQNNSITNPNMISVGNDGEWDWVLEHNGLAATEYCFRMVTSNGVALSEYEQYPTLTTNASPNTPTLVDPFDNEKTSTTTPTFEFSTSDTEGNDVTYQIQIDDDYLFGSVNVDRNSTSHGTQFENLATPADKDPFTNGEAIEFHLASALSNGTTYYWRVRANDPDGSVAAGEWSEVRSFTIDTSLTASAWYQTDDGQFETDTWEETATSSDTMVLASGFTIGTTTGTSIDFDWGTVGNAWGSLAFTDTETSSDLKYKIEYFADEVWTAIPDSVLSGNSAGFDTSPVSLLGLDTDIYNVIRVVAKFTDSGTSPVLSDWTINWGFKILPPTIEILFPNEKQATTTPILQFYADDPEDDELVYQVSWSTSYAFTASTTRTSDTDVGFANVESPGDTTSPFNSGEAIQFTIQPADALTDTVTYWWRVRAKDPTPGSDTYSDFTDPQSFTVDSATTVSTWYQTTSEQFLTNTLAGATTTALDAITVATTAVESLVGYAEGTAQNPRYRLWNGSVWDTEEQALSVGSAINWVVVKPGETREEYLLGTLGTDGDVNIQVYQNGAWGTMQEITDAVPNTTARGFDITYESVSGDGIVVSCDGDADPVYYVWNGTWTLGGTINIASTGNCAWIRLISDPTSDEIVMVSRDSSGTRYEMFVWDGSSWSNGTDLGSMNEAAHEGIGASYEESGGQAVVAVSNGTNNSFVWKAWNGSTWSATTTVSIGDDFEAGMMVSDVGTDNMALCYVDEDNDIGTVKWTGAGFTAFAPADEVEVGWAAGNTVKNDRPVDCIFEVGGARDGYILVAYSDTTNVRHRAWNGSAWDAGETSVSTMEDSARVQLRRTSNNLVQLIAYDMTNDDYNYSDWNGTVWSTHQTLESDGVSGAYPYKEPFTIAPRNPGTTATVIGSPLIDYDDGSGPYWQQFSWTDTEPGGSSILYQVEYYNVASSTWDLIPDSLLPGNSTGTSTSPISLSSVLPVTTYNQIRPVANLSCSLGVCPTLQDWTITWAAGINISGSARQYDQSTNLTSGTVAVALNGTLQTGKTGTISGGAWSIANVNARAGDVITVFIQGAADSDEAVAVTKYDGVGDVTGMELFQRHLSIGSADLSTTTNADIGQYDFTNSEDLFADVSAGDDLTVCATTGCFDAELYVKAGNVYQPGTNADVTTHSIENNGTFLPNGNTIRLAGNWDNNATATMATSTVIFTATSTTQTVDNTGAASTTFYNVTFGETSGTATWNLVTGLDIDGALQVNYGTLARNTMAVTVAGGLTNGAGGLWTGVGTTTFDGSGAALWTDSAGTKQNIGNVVIDGTSKTVTFGSNVRAESVTIGSDDILDASVTGFDITVLRNWTNNNTFVARTGEVIFAATTTNALITQGGSSFYDLTFNGAGGSWSFAGSALTIGNDFVAATGTVTLPTGTTTIAGSWNSTGGLFAHNNAGVTFTSSASETITLAGAAFTNAFYNVAFTGSGSWSFASTNATTSNDMFISAGTVTFPSGALALGGSLIKSGGTIAGNGGTLQLTSSAAETIQTGGSSLASLLFTGSGTWSFVDTNITATGDMTIAAGTVTAPSGTLTLGGSFTNTATFTHNSGTVLFNATATGKTISPGSSPFYNVTFSSVTGGWTIGNHATTTNNLTLTAASSFTLSASNVLSVGGTFTNSMGGASTTWSGTLALVSGTIYSLNTKTNTGDVYGDLVVSGGTHVSMWNSSATTPLVQGASSVYSQDHAGIDGDLYVYGTYVRTSGTEHWSAATDFDGTALSGSERQVDVRFASGATAAFSGATLSIVGTSTATTTIASQSGTYLVSMGNGTTTAAYYSFDNLGASGVTLASSTKVTSLSDGSFTAGVNTGTTLTLSSTTIDANPELQIYRVMFATTTAIGATNVTQLDGTPASYWWFRESTGNLEGETLDNDTGDPGSVRWDDSNLVIEISGTVFADDGATPLGNPTCDGSTQVVKVVVNGGASSTGFCNSGDGSYSVPGVVVVGDPVITVYLDTNGGVKATTITKTPTADISNLDLYANRVVTRHEDTAALTIADMSVYDEGDDSDISFAATVGTPNTLTLRSNTELFIASSTTFAPGGDVTLQSGGTGSAYDGSLHIDNNGTWTAVGTSTLDVGGRFVVDAGATFTAASTTVSMTATTTGKSIQTPSPQSITFNNLSFIGVGGGWSVDGDIIVQGTLSMSTGTLSGTEDITLTNGSFSGNGTVTLTAGTTLLSRTNTLGGTTPWTFANLTLGNGSVVGTTTPPSATTTVSGTLTISNAHVLDAGSSQWNLAGGGAAFTLTGTFDADTSLVRYSGSSATNITSATYYNLDLNASAGAPTYTGVGLGINILNTLTVGGTAPTTVDLNTNDPAVNVDGSVVIRSNGTLQGSASAVFTVAQNWDNDGTFTSNNGTITFDSASAGILSAGASSFGSVTVNKSGAFTINENATATAAFTLTAASAYTLNSGVALAVGGTFTNALGGAATTWTGSTLSLYGGGNYQINASTTNDAYGTLSVEANTDIRMWNSSATAISVNSSGSLYSQDHAAVDGALFIYGDYVRASGTDYWSYATDFDGTALGGSARAVTVSFAANATGTLAGGALNIVGGASASTTITNQGSGTFALTVSGGTFNAQYYALRNMRDTGLVMTGTPTITTLSNGDIEVSQNGGTGITVGGDVITLNPAKTFSGNRFATTTAISATNVTATGTSISSWRFTNHTGNLSGEDYNIDPDGDPGYVVWEDSAGTITISGNVYSDEGSTPIGGPTCNGVSPTVGLMVRGLTYASTTCDATTGLYTFTDVGYADGDALVVYLDTNGGAQAANITVDPLSSMSNMHLYQNRVIVRHEDTAPVTIVDMSLWDSSDDTDIPFTAVDGSPDVLTLPANTKLIVWNSKTFTPGGNVTLSGGGGGAAYDGTLELYSNASFVATGAESHSIGGSLVSGGGATIAGASATFTFTTNGSARTIDTNDGALHNATFNGTGSWTLSDTNLAIGNDLTITAGSVTLPVGTTTIAGSFLNTGGSFIHSSGTVNFTSTSAGETVRPGSSDLHKIVFDGAGGTWSFFGSNATATKEFLVKAGTVTLPSGTLTVAGPFEVTGGAFTHNSGTVKLTATTTDTVVRSNGSNFNSLSFSGSGSYTVFDVNQTLLGSLFITQGTTTFATGTLSIGGSFLNTGGAFVHSSGTILFNSADTGESINPGSSLFYNVSLASASGGWSITGNATTSGNFSLTSATSFTQATGTKLTVYGVFTNTVGGAATNWAGSTLDIQTGTSYTINTSSLGGDQYQSLLVGSTTKLRMWNSAATSTSVASLSSLYSQDHAEVNGALYIYGDYARTSGTDYWSYATDFDGTALGGSPRAVTVSFAANATGTFSGATLEVLGAASASTTITNQGSGTYALSVLDGVINAQYYTVRNGNTTGLSLGGLTTVTSLSYGDFEVAVAGGSAMTVSSTTLNANASLVFPGMRFATTTAIAGYNITLTGTTPNAWTFTSHTGNLAGEEFDVDGGDECGSLRWTDSVCLITEQTHYRWRNNNGGESVPDSEWYDLSWSKRKRVGVTNADATTYTDAAVKMTITYDADMQSDFDDLRFTDSSGTTSIPFWIEKYTASTDAVVWVKVPTLVASDETNVYMYYGNGGVSGGSVGTTTFAMFDAFEDGGITEYSGDTSKFSVGSTNVYERTYRLNASNVNDRTVDGIYNTSATVSQGQTIRYFQYIDTSTGSGDEACTLFGVQSPGSNNNNYAVCLELFGTDRVSLAKNVYDNDSNGTVLASSTITYATGWYEVEVRWDTDDSMDVSVSQNGSVVATTSATDSSYTTGGVGFTYWFQHGGWDAYTARPLLQTEPTVVVSVEQASGGATWYADLDTLASDITVGTTQRLRFVIDNGGLAITNQQLRLEYASKGAAPSCEAVSYATYTEMPVQGSCGTSPMCMQTSTYFSNQASTTDLLLGDGAFTYGQIIESPSNKTQGLSIGASTFTEVEYALEPTTYATGTAYCLRVTNDGTDLDSYSRIAEIGLRFNPTVTSWSFNNGEDIVPSPGTTTTVYATGTVSDANGYADLLHATATIYRSLLGPSCTADNNNCYQLGSSSCSLSSCSGNSCEVSCAADIYFFADPTDYGTFSAQDWRADIQITDQSGGSDTQSTFGSELQTIRALEVNSAIAYGALEVNSDTGSYNPTTTIENIGNDAIDVTLSGTNLSDGASSIIPVTTQKYATSTFTYSGCTSCSTLSTTSSAYEVDLSKPTTTTPVLSDELYWGISIPFGASAAAHQGVNTFIATGD